jgi:hypothetical protein
MDKFFISIVLIFWFIFTLLLACSIIGIMVLIREDHDCKGFQGEAGEAVWFRIGKMLVNKLIK